jgi:SAM-dependent methyltransferase
MGLGGNAGFLLERGWRVVGVDISDVAVYRAKSHLPELYAVIADMKSFWLPPSSLDAILNFYYLQRDLWPRYWEALRPGGILFFQTLTQEMLSIQPEIDPAFLLAPGELLAAFAGWEILFYRESWETSHRGRPQAVASLVACKP